MTSTKRAPTDASASEQGPGSHHLLLDHQGALHDRRGDGRRLPQRQPEFRPDRHLDRHRRRYWRSPWSFQFRATRYIPAVYWLTVTLVSVFGTLVTDNLTDNLGVPLEASTLIFAALLAVTFVVWYRIEHTLSIHSILTRRREAFYWLAILFTFALGTAAGDLMAEGLGLGYLVTGIIVAALIAITAVGWKLGLNSVLAFWIIYILTRPLGASIGDYLSQPTSHGGLGLGATVTSMIFVGGIIAIVIYLSVTKADVITGPPADGIRPSGTSSPSNEAGCGRPSLSCALSARLPAEPGTTCGSPHSPRKPPTPPRRQRTLPMASRRRVHPWAT